MGREIRSLLAISSCVLPAMKYNHAALAALSILMLSASCPNDDPPQDIDHLWYPGHCPNQADPGESINISSVDCSIGSESLWQGVPPIDSASANHSNLMVVFSGSGNSNGKIRGGCHAEKPCPEPDAPYLKALTSNGQAAIVSRGLRPATHALWRDFRQNNAK